MVSSAPEREKRSVEKLISNEGTKETPPPPQDSAEEEPLLSPERRRAQEGRQERMNRAETRRQMLHIFGVFVPLVVFWGIFYQQNSTWVLQGTQMNCYIGSLHVPPGNN